MQINDTIKSAKNTRPLNTWFAACVAIFFARAFLFSTWLSRGPEVKIALQLDTAEMGLLAMLFPIGGLLGIGYASRLTNRLGSKVLTIGGYSVAALCLAGLGFTIDLGLVWPTAILLLVMGAPMAIVDYLGNFEGTEVDKASPRTLLPAIHSAFGLGMMAAAALSSYLIGQRWSIATNYLVVAAFSAAISIVAAFEFPHRNPLANLNKTANAASTALGSVWTEKRSLLVALIGFSFIMAEMAAGTWAPIALTMSGVSAANAASALSIFWVLVTLGRAFGGVVVDVLGRKNSVLISAVVTASGIAVFMLDSVLHQPYVGLVLWGLGMAMGFPLSVAAMGDDPVRAPARINMLVSVVYIASISVGPALGSAGQLIGIYLAFGIPLTFLLIAALLSANAR